MRDQHVFPFQICLGITQSFKSASASARISQTAVKVWLLAITPLTTWWGDVSHGTEEPPHFGEGIHMENDVHVNGKDTR